MENNLLIKVCGMREGANIREVEKLGIKMIGFVFYPKSPRCITELPSYLPQKAKRVGIFINEEKKLIETLADRFSLDYIQLHGNESPEYCRTLKSKGLRLIKRFSLESTKDLKQTSSYKDSCDFFLFVAKSKQSNDSSSIFDWKILKDYHEETPFLIGGGINLYSIDSIKRFKHPRFVGIDINSRFESEIGKKDVERIKTFLHHLKT